MLAVAILVTKKKRLKIYLLLSLGSIFHYSETNS